MKTLFIKSLATIAVGGGLLLIAQSCIDSEGKTSAIPKSAEPIPVRISELHRSDVDQSIVTSGRMTTNNETILSFKTGGIVNNVFVDEGDRIAKGQVLATLDLTEINTLVAQAKSGLEKAERDLDRAKNLYRDSVATLEQLQNAETAFDVANQQYNAANFNRTYSQIKAPESGFVLKKFVNPGQVVGIGDAIVRTNGAGDGKWILRTGVSDRQWTSIHLNDMARVTIDAFPDKVFHGTVIRKSETADPSTGTFTVEISVANANARFATGMFASATIKGSDKVNMWRIPYDAVLDANGNEGFVFVTADKKVAVRRPVRIESFDGASVTVSSGLEGAQALIISGSAYLTDKSPITIIH
jgi:RND family efflux transporter MFP subunit